MRIAVATLLLLLGGCAGQLGRCERHLQPINDEARPPAMATHRSLP